MTHTILVVDDEEDIRLFLRTLLRDHGFEVLLAVDGVQALELMRQHKPDLISLDLQMPNKTGTDFYRRLARDKELRDTPVIVVSGLSGRHLAVREPAAVFDKPIDSDRFIEEVKKALAGV